MSKVKIGVKMKILAVKWEVKEENGERSIQLYDSEGNKVNGSEARWEGNFSCSYNQLTSLTGAPSEVGGSFYCYNNQLTSLTGAPSEVGGDFYGDNNQLTSLTGAPKEVGGGFYCDNNQLTSLTGAPSEVGSDFSCDNSQLTSLTGAPSEVGGNFYCYDNQLTSLTGAPSEVGGYFYCSYNQLPSNVKLHTQYKRTEIQQRIFQRKLNRGYVYADGILQRLVKQRKQGKYEIFTVESLGSKKRSYVVKHGDVFSHGKLLKDAMEDLIYKVTDRDTTEYQTWSTTKKVSKKDMIQAYRKITGACEFGVKEFIKNNNVPDKVTVNAVIKLTQGRYGHETFREFFGK